MTRDPIPLATAVCVAALMLLLGSAIEQWVPGTRDKLDADALTPPARRVTVEVRNAGGVTGAARAATERLRQVGYDVVQFGNAASFGPDSSVVLDRTGDPETAAAVARALGIRRVVSQPNPNLYVDVTVRIGAEWKVPDTGGGESSLRGAGAWWSRFLGELGSAPGSRGQSDVG